MTQVYASPHHGIASGPPAPIYLVSGRFDYDRWPVLHGPRYGAALGMIPRVWNAGMASNSSEVWIVDQRMLAEDVEEIEKFAWRYPEQPLVLRVVDPYWPPEDCNPLRDLAFRLVGRANTAVLLAYQPVEVTRLLLLAYGPRRVFVSPYPYLQERQINGDAKRQRKVLISGNSTQSVYPLRRLARHKRWRSLSWRRFSADLAHPGYAPSAEQPGVSIGSDYLRFLASFEAMFVCPSRAGLEFFKYGECAYAGCAPVGAPPEGFPAAAADCILPFDASQMRQSIHRIVSTSADELRERAEAYRKALVIHRDPVCLRRDLKDWLQLLWPTQVLA